MEQQIKAAGPQCVCDHSVGHTDEGRCVVCEQCCGPVSNEVGQRDLAAWDDSAAHVRLLETFAVHVANCDKCGNGSLNQCATGQALKEDAYPQNDSVNGNKEYDALKRQKDE